MSLTLLTNSLQQPGGFAIKLASWLLPRQQQKRSTWTLEQLQVQPYQHLLEVGYGTGNTLQEVARRLKVGFIAGIDPSISMYRQARRRNERYIQQELMQLHFGQLHELSYPAHYFHTIYGTNAHLRWDDPQREFIRLANLLKDGGKMIMVFQPSATGKDKAVRESVEKIENDYNDAGLTDIRIRYHEMQNGMCVAAHAYKK